MNQQEKNMDNQNKIQELKDITANLERAQEELLWHRTKAIDLMVNLRSLRQFSIEGIFSDKQREDVASIMVKSSSNVFEDIAADLEALCSRISTTIYETERRIELSDGYLSTALDVIGNEKQAINESPECKAKNDKIRKEVMEEVSKKATNNLHKEECAG